MVTERDTEEVDTVAIHEFQQSDVIKRRYYPMYRNTHNDKIEAKLKPQECHEPITHRINVSQIMIRGTIDKNHIPGSLLDAITSIGVC